jgi:hypothetical protein
MFEKTRQYEKEKRKIFFVNKYQYNVTKIKRTLY